MAAALSYQVKIIHPPVKTGAYLQLFEQSCLCPAAAVPIHFIKKARQQIRLGLFPLPYPLPGAFSTTESYNCILTPAVVITGMPLKPTASLNLVLKTFCTSVNSLHFGFRV